jgi:hypothetical protein
VLFTFAYEAMGAAETPGIPCALFVSEGRRQSLGHVVPRECGAVSETMDYFASGADLTFATHVPRILHANVDSKSPLASSITC